MLFYHYTNIGPRSENEDALNVVEYHEYSIASIADGVGSSQAGKYASSYAVDTFFKMVSPSNFDKLVEIIKKIHDDLIEYSIVNTKKKNSAATTFTACVIQNMKLIGIHVGDSKLYILRGNGLRQLSKEHSEAARLHREKLINYDEYKHYPRKNVIESALGVPNMLHIDTFNFDLESRDRIILSTDGFHELFNKSSLRDMSVNNIKCEDFYNELVASVNVQKLRDNTSFILMEI